MSNATFQPRHSKRVFSSYYRPQAKLSVCPQGGGCLSLLRGGGCLPLVPGGVCHTPRQTPPLGRHPLWADTPSGQTPPLGRHPLWADTPSGQTPPAQCMLGYTPPGRHPLPSAYWDTHPQADTPTAQCMLGYTPPAPCMLGYTPPPSACWDTSWLINPEHQKL